MIAVYPGTFDPMTRGHFDLIMRAAKLYDRLIVAVAATSSKEGAMFPAAERLEMIREDVARANINNVEVKILDTLLVDFCRREGSKVVIRGVRVYSDFEYEFQMALTNRRLAPEIETLFMMPSSPHVLKDDKSIMLIPPYLKILWIKVQPPSILVSGLRQKQNPPRGS